MNNPRSRNPTGGDDPRSKYRKGCVLFDTDPQEQSRLMEQGEELRLAVTRGNLERVHAILDSGELLSTLFGFSTLFGPITLVPLVLSQ